MSEDKKKKIRRRNIKLIIASAIILALLIFILTDKGKQLWDLFQLNGEQFKKYIESKGKWGPALFFLLSYLQVVIAPIPGQITYFVGGMLFGTWGGFAVNHTATVLASVTVYWLGRAFGEPLTDKQAGNGKTKKVVDFVKRNGPIFFLLAFLIPGLPDDLLCYVAGIVMLPFSIFLFLALVARIPSTLSLAFLGDGVLKWTTGQMILVIVIMLVLIGLVIIFRKPITNFLNMLVRKESKDDDVDITDMMT